MCEAFTAVKARKRQAGFTMDLDMFLEIRRFGKCFATVTAVVTHLNEPPRAHVIQPRKQHRLETHLAAGGLHLLTIGLRINILRSTTVHVSLAGNRRVAFAPKLLRHTAVSRLGGVDLVSLHVSLERYGDPELFPAFSAPKRLLAGVRPHVSSEADRLSESSVADLALVRLLTGMYSHVYHAVSRPRKRLATHRTRERLLAGVDSHVIIQRTAAGELLIADDA
jgi:hypothetical protein